MAKMFYGFIKNNRLFFVLLVFTCCFTFWDYTDRYNFPILAILFLIGFGALYGVFLGIHNQKISLSKTFYLFYYFFFSLAPIVQYKHNTTFYFNGTIDNQTYMNACLLVLSSLFFYMVFYNKLTTFMIKREVFKPSENKLHHNENQKMTTIWSFFISILSVILYVYLIKFKWSLLYDRAYGYDLKNNTNLGLLGYSLLNIVRLIPFVVFMNSTLKRDKYKKDTLLLFLLMLVTCFPLALSRGMMAMIYIPVLVLHVPKLRKISNYIGMYCVSILVLFPLFNMFRSIKAKGLVFDYGLFNSAHFDAFHNFSLLVRENIVTHGEQLLTSVLFFVQESAWPNKPPGTGHVLAQKLEFSHENVAMPLVGEGYANFGCIGVFLFITILIFINVFLERFKSKNTILKLFFYIFLAYEFYLLRGDLWSSVKILTSFSMAIFVFFTGEIILKKISKSS